MKSGEIKRTHKRRAVKFIRWLDTIIGEAGYPEVYINSLKKLRTNASKVFKMKVQKKDSLGIRHIGNNVVEHDSFTTVCLPDESKNKVETVSTDFAEMFRDKTFCQQCGKSNWKYFGDGGGCGGRGQEKACLECKSVYVQVSGSMFANSDGEIWQLVPRRKFDARKEMGG